MLKKPKFKIARRLGAGVYDKTQTPKFAASAKGPRGSMGGKRPKAPTEYGAQLLEKQKVRFSYGITERQLGNYVRKAARIKGVGSVPKLLELLESRLDNAVYRMGLAPSRRAARQMVSHGHFMVNAHRVTVPSYELKPGDVIKVREGSLGRKIFENLTDRLKDYSAPSWLSFDVGRMEGRMQGKPESRDTFLDLNAVLEFYSR